MAFVGRVAEPFAEQNAPYWCILVHTGATAKRAHAKSARAKHVRRNVTLPAKIARQVEVFARQRDLSDNRMLVELIERESKRNNKKRKHSSSWRNVSPPIPRPLCAYVSPW
jgi:hypothetical protein